MKTTFSVRPPRWLLAAVVLPLALLACASDPQEPAEGTAAPMSDQEVNIDEKAETQLRAMSIYLEGLGAFEFSAHQTFGEHDVNSSFLIQRANKMRVETDGDRGRQTVVYDGVTLAIAFHDDQAWATVDVPDTLDAMADHMSEEYGVPLHLADLLASSPYDSLVVGGTNGRYSGLEDGDDGSCHLLEFSNDAVDWQVCVAAEGDPLPMRFSIHYKDAPGAPRRSTSFADWNVQPEILGDTFVFEAPEGFDEIDFVASGAGEQS